MFAHFRTQVGPHNCLPCPTRGRLFSGTDQSVDGFSKTLFQGLNEQLVLAREVFVKPSVRQAGIAHDSGKRCPIQALSTDAPGGIFHDLLVCFDFVFGPITHGYIGCCESSQGATLSSKSPPGKINPNRRHKSTQRTLNQREARRDETPSPFTVKTIPI